MSTEPNQHDIDDDNVQVTFPELEMPLWQAIEKFKDDLEIKLAHLIDAYDEKLKDK